MVEGRPLKSVNVAMAPWQHWLHFGCYVTKICDLNYSKNDSSYFNSISLVRCVFQLKWSKMVSKTTKYFFLKNGDGSEMSLKMFPIKTNYIDQLHNISIYKLHKFKTEVCGHQCFTIIGITAIWRKPRLALSPAKDQQIKIFLKSFLMKIFFLILDY